jgi:hypothetical protein
MSLKRNLPYFLAYLSLIIAAIGLIFNGLATWALFLYAFCSHSFYRIIFANRQDKFD